MSNKVLTDIGHFFGIVWSGVAKTEKTIEKDAPAIEADVNLAVDVTALINPAAGETAKVIVAGGMTALGAFTEALEATTKTVDELEGESGEFATVTVRREALVQVAKLFSTYKQDFEALKQAFENQVKAGAQVAPAIPANKSLL